MADVWLETKIARQRVNRELANAAMLTRKAIMSIFSDEGGREFNEAVQNLME